MYTFDVYLKNRLHEIDVIITQLVQRDTLTMYNILYLYCEIAEVNMLKSLKINSDMELQAKIEQILETVYEKLDSISYLDCDIDMTEKVLTGGSTGMTLSVEEFSAIEKDLISCQSEMYLSVSPFDPFYTLSLGKSDMEMELRLDKMNFLKEGFEKFENEFKLFVETEFTNYKRADMKELNMTIDISPAGLFYLLPVMSQTIMYLDVAPIGRYILTKVIYDTEFKTELSADMENPLLLEKFANSETLMRLLAEVAAILINFIDLSENKMLLSCAMSAGLKRCRKLYELDDFTLDDMDNRTLDDLDYVILID